MHITLNILRAVGLVVLAALFFLGIQELIGANVIGGSQHARCVGQPITGCFLTII